MPDRLDATREALRRAAAGNDLIVTCGGVSVGEEDHIKPAVEAEGRLDLWQIAMKPGKPLAFGEVFRGDGSSALVHRPAGQPGVGFVTFLLPCGRSCCACRARRELAPRPIAHARRLRLAASPTGGASSCACAATTPAGWTCSANQGSGVLTSTVWADGLVDNPAGQAIAPGDTVRYLPFARAARHEGRGALFRVGARGARRRARTSRSAPAPTSPRCATRSIARGGRHAEALARGARAAQRAEPGALRRERAARAKATRSASSRRSPAAEGDAMAAARVSIQTDDFDLGAEVAALRAGDARRRRGRRFVGTVRDRNDGAAVQSLELEHYPGMTEAAIEAMIDEALRRFEIRAARVIHRIGAARSRATQIVLVAVTSAHRGEASRPASS